MILIYIQKKIKLECLKLIYFQRMEKNILNIFFGYEEITLFFTKEDFD